MQNPIQITDVKGTLLALIVHDCQAQQPGVQFFTPMQAALQVGCMLRPKGEIVTPHTHYPNHRSISVTGEVLYIQSGRARLTVFSNENVSVGRVYLYPRSCALLLRGGHALEALENCQILEVKQGPFQDDKIPLEVKELEW